MTKVRLDTWLLSQSGIRKPTRSNNCQWCVQVLKNQPGHPKKMSTRQQRKTSLWSAALLLDIWATLSSLLKALHPLDMTVEEWKYAPNEMKVIRQPNRGGGNYVPEMGYRDWKFDYDTCDWKAWERHWRNIFYCPICKNSGNWTWFEIQLNLVHRGLNPESDGTIGKEEDVVYSEDSYTCIVILLSIGHQNIIKRRNTETDWWRSQEMLKSKSMEKSNALSSESLFTVTLPLQSDRWGHSPKLSQTKLDPLARRTKSTSMGRTRMEKPENYSE